MKITEAEFNKLYDANVSKREYDEIVSRIDERFYEIMATICPSLKRTGWVDYGNCNYDADDSGGWFDPDYYKEEIEVGGQFTLPEPYNCGCSFPTRWLWEDNFKSEFDAEVEACKQEKEKKKETLKSKKAEMRKVIEAKLTKEELKFIKFK
jgi:hypothetical protein